MWGAGLFYIFGCADTCMLSCRPSMPPYTLNGNQLIFYTSQNSFYIWILYVSTPIIYFIKSADIQILSRYSIKKSIAAHSNYGLIVRKAILTAKSSLYKEDITWVSKELTLFRSRWELSQHGSSYVIFNEHLYRFSLYILFKLTCVCDQG